MGRSSVAVIAAAVLLASCSIIPYHTREIELRCSSATAAFATNDENIFVAFDIKLAGRSSQEGVVIFPLQSDFWDVDCDTNLFFYIGEATPMASRERPDSTLLGREWKTFPARLSRNCIVRRAARPLPSTTELTLRYSGQGVVSDPVTCAIRLPK